MLGCLGERNRMWIKSPNDASQITLFSQMRSEGKNDYITFVDNLLKEKLGNNTTIFNNPNYELALFDDLSLMMERLKQFLFKN